jgi:conjugal transfer pilus assembly protein TraF
MMRSKLISKIGSVVLAAAGLIPVLVSAEPAFFLRGEEGWFWYQRLPDPIEPPDPDPALPATPPGPVTATPPLSTAWFRAHIQDYMDQAIDNPTPDNVRAFLYLQRVMMDKGNRFADVSQQVVMGDPFLDEISRRPLAPFAAQQMDRAAGAARDGVLQDIASQAGLFFFYRSDCPYCQLQAPIMAALQEQFGFEVFAIAVDGLPLPNGAYPDYRPDTGQAQALGVNTVPAIFLVQPPGTLEPVGQGAMTLDELGQRLVSVAHARGWIDDTAYAATRPVQLGTSLAAQPPSDQNWPQDPAALVQYLRTLGGF